MAKQASVIRVATLLVEGRAPVTRVDCTPGLSGRSPSTLQKWFRKQFGGITVRISRWSVKHSSQTIEVRGIVEAPRLLQPRQVKASRPCRAAKARVKPGATPTTLARQKRRETYRTTAIAKRAYPRKPASATPKVACTPPPRRAKAFPHCAPTAQVVVVTPWGKGFGLGFCGTVPDHGISDERLLKSCRKLMHQHGITTAAALHLQAHVVADRPQTRVVVIHSRSSTCTLKSLHRNGATPALAQWLQDNADHLTATCAAYLADDDLRLRRHAERSLARHHKRPGWLPEDHPAQAAA